MTRAWLLVALAACAPPAGAPVVENHGTHPSEPRLSIVLVTPSRYDRDVSASCSTSGRPRPVLEAPILHALLEHRMVTPGAQILTIPPRTPDGPLEPHHAPATVADVVALDLRTGEGSLLVAHPTHNDMVEANLYCARMAGTVLVLDHSRRWIINN